MKFSSFRKFALLRSTNPKGNEIRINPKNPGRVDWTGRFSETLKSG